MLTYFQNKYDSKIVFNNSNSVNLFTHGRACRPYTGENLKEIQINGFTGPHSLSLWDFTLIEVETLRK